MSTKIGLISDTHSSLAPLLQALDIFQREQVNDIICAGDIAGYGEDQLAQSVALLQQHHCLSIAGNHDQSIHTDEMAKHPAELDAFFKQLPSTLQLEREGKRLYVVHAHPPNSQHGGIKLLDPQGQVMVERKHAWQQKLAAFDYDVLIVGHTHQVFAEQLGNVLVINPGSTQFNHTCMMLELPSMQVKVFALMNKEPILCWNWGIFFNKIKV